MLEKNLRQVLNSYGYRDIETPTFEFFDVFGSQMGTTPSRELYKFFDREGNTLVLRPDFTPSIARAASKYFMDEERPIRLCYLGNTFVNNSSYQGHLKETTQLGAELIGDGTAEADAEIIALVIATLLRAGLREFQISVGHADFFRALAEEAGLDEETGTQLRELIENKNTFGVEKLLGEKEMPKEWKRLFMELPGLFGGREVLEQALAMTKGGHASWAVERLLEVWELLQIYEMERYVSFDLGLSGTYRYYTGVVFRGYTYGIGDAVVKGGRYDTLLSHFGKETPAIGFVAVMDQLMNALSRQKIDILSEQGRYLILYRKKNRREAICKALEYRRQGKFAELCLGEDLDLEEKRAFELGQYAGIIRIGE